MKLQDILEATIAKLSGKITVRLSVEKTKHAGERQFRHQDTVIEKEDIIATAKKAFPIISN